MLSVFTNPVFSDSVADLIRLAETTGFYLMQLDVRQESGIHLHAVADILEQLGITDEYDGMSEVDRLAILSDLIRQDTPPSVNRRRLRAETRDVLEVFDHMTYSQEFDTTLSSNANQVSTLSI